MANNSMQVYSRLLTKSDAILGLLHRLDNQFGSANPLDSSSKLYDLLSKLSGAGLLSVQKIRWPFLGFLKSHSVQKLGIRFVRTLSTIIMRTKAHGVVVFAPD